MKLSDIKGDQHLVNPGPFIGMENVVITQQVLKEMYEGGLITEVDFKSLRKKVGRGIKGAALAGTMAAGAMGGAAQAQMSPDHFDYLNGGAHPSSQTQQADGGQKSFSFGKKKAAGKTVKSNDKPPIPGMVRTPSGGWTNAGKTVSNADVSTADKGGSSSSDSNFKKVVNVPPRTKFKFHTGTPDTDDTDMAYFAFKDNGKKQHFGITFGSKKDMQDNYAHNTSGGPTQNSDLAQKFASHKGPHKLAMSLELGHEVNVGNAKTIKIFVDGKQVGHNILQDNHMTDGKYADFPMSTAKALQKGNEAEMHIGDYKKITFDLIGSAKSIDSAWKSGMKHYNQYNK